MKIIFGIHSLAGFGGTETYVATVGDYLQRAGHDVWIYALEDGDAAKRAHDLGLRTVTDKAPLPDRIDVALVQDYPASAELLARCPGVPQVFVWHSELFDLQLPPQLDGAISHIITLNHRAHRRLDSLAIKLPMTRLTQPVDARRFTPLRDLPREARVALSLGNYLKGERLDLLARACELAGLEFRHVGVHGSGVTSNPEDHMNAADIVFGKGRVIYEALACGRAAYVLDAFGSAGWVTPESYERLVADNFAGTTSSTPLTAESLADDLRGYNSGMGIVNRDLAVSHHQATAHTSEVVKILEQVVAQAPAQVAATHDGLFELSRLARVNWRHEGQAYRLSELLNDAERAKADLAWRLEQAEAELATQTERGDSAEKTAQELLASARFRLGTKLLAPLDRIRGKGGA
ncbi:MAG: hypothetical protein WAP35_03725 [Solirubrobacterales bacterium]